MKSNASKKSPTTELKSAPWPAIAGILPTGQAGGEDGHGGTKSKSKWKVLTSSIPNTRKQAIEDGVLVDVTDTAKEAGFRFPVAVTAAVWADIENIPGSQAHQSTEGRLWDVLSMLSFAIRNNRDECVICYRIIMHVGRRKFMT